LAAAPTLTAQCCPVVTDGVTITGAGTVASPLVAASLGGGSVTITSPNQTVTVGGTASAPTVDVNWTDADNIEGAQDALAPALTPSGLVTYNDAGNSFQAGGAAGQVPVSNGAGVVTWQTPAAGAAVTVQAFNHSPTSTATTVSAGAADTLGNLILRAGRGLDIVRNGAGDFTIASHQQMQSIYVQDYTTNQYNGAGTAYGTTPVLVTNPVQTFNNATPYPSIVDLSFTFEGAVFFEAAYAPAISIWYYPQININGSGWVDFTPIYADPATYFVNVPAPGNPDVWGDWLWNLRQAFTIAPGGTLTIQTRTQFFMGNNHGAGVIRYIHEGTIISGFQSFELA
jgi:hypothetical protein